VPYQVSAAQLSANNSAPPQLRAASSELHVNSAPLQLSADVNSAPNKKIKHQLSAAELIKKKIHD
jgi:hypothetical protein